MISLAKEFIKTRRRLVWRHRPGAEAGKPMQGLKTGRHYTRWDTLAPPLPLFKLTEKGYALCRRQKFLYNCQPYAGVAQSVEQHIRNVRVVGSIPITGSNKIKPLRESEGLFYCLWGTDGALTYNRPQQNRLLADHAFLGFVTHVERTRKRPVYEFTPLYAEKQM
jgi:hypothetical protein